MNSEVLAEMMKADKLDTKIQREKIELAENQVISEGAAIEEMLSTSGWKIMLRDLDQIHVGLTNKLMHEPSLNKSQMERYIDRINNIAYLRNNPMKYISRMKMLITRKTKEK